jgi:hypothetical protein
VLRDAGYADGDIAALRECGAIHGARDEAGVMAIHD